MRQSIQVLRGQIQEYENYYHTGNEFLDNGFGIPNIKKAAERYGGWYSIKEENGIFTLKIMIPVS